MYYLFRIVTCYFYIRTNQINGNSKRGEVDYGSHSEPQKKLERAFPRVYRTLQTKMKRKVQDTGRSLNFMQGDVETARR